jgi:tricarballylate dehydrogenase
MLRVWLMGPLRRVTRLQFQWAAGLTLSTLSQLVYKGMRPDPDVLVIGGGNAGLCAALAARRRGASVLLVERGSRLTRGGNSKYTRNMRCVHDGPDEVMVESYSAEELRADLAGVTGEGSDKALTDMVIDLSRQAPGWMEENGARWQSAMNGTLQLSRTNRFFLGGGKALLNAFYSAARKKGVEVAYDTSAIELGFDGERCVAVTLEHGSGRSEVRPRAVVAASGGFEANLEWLREFVGDGVDQFAVRGASQNDGRILRNLLDQGARQVGNPRGFHAVAVDARGPRYDGGIVTRIDSLPFGIVVDRCGRRFYDEGEDLWPKRYATWGGRIAEQPGQVAFSIFDRKILGRFMSTAYPPVVADTVGELAERLGVPVEGLVSTVTKYNAAVVDGTYDAARLDDCRTDGLVVPKSHWALRIDEPPFYGYPLRPGLTFTYLAVAVAKTMRVKTSIDGEFENVYAAGELMAGNILMRGYLAGFGMTIGAVSGHLAGRHAAGHADA